MGAWDAYKSRIQINGKTSREESLLYEKWYFSDRSKDGLFYHTVKINGETVNLNIINSDNLNEKMIYSMPDETFPCGGYMEWAGNIWLITEKDANDEVYTRGKVLQCNHLLKWIDPETREIHEQWCVVEDGTKYLTGELEDRSFIVTRGDSRISVQIAKNRYTAAFNRECRFLIDDPDSPHKLSYLLTKPLKTGLTYNGEGTYKFVLQEVTATEDDNHELGIADYYKYFPKNTTVEIGDKADKDESDEKKVWI